MTRLQQQSGSTVELPVCLCACSMMMIPRLIIHLIGVECAEYLCDVGARVGHLCLDVLNLSKCLHLILDLLEDGCGCSWHTVEVFDVHLVKFVTDVLLYGLDEEIQVLHIVHRTLALRRHVCLVLHRI